MVRERGGPKEASRGISQSPAVGFIKYVSGKEASAADWRAGFDDPGVPQEARKEEMKVIPLTQGQVAFVSDHRFQDLNQFKWHAQWRGTLRSGSFYAARNSGGKCISMHEQILGMKCGYHRCGDHRYGNTLDNCDYNLRLATRTQNNVNQRKQSGTSSKYKGVSFNRRDKKWQAAITVNKRRISLGYFDDEEKAA